MLNHCEAHPGRKKILLSIFYLLIIFQACNKENRNTGKNNSAGIITEIKDILKDEIELWYPLVIDTTYGGVLSDINYKWEPEGVQNKMIVTQARHIWSASSAFEFSGNDSSLLNTAAHGFRFLRDKMWDDESGGFYELVDREGTPIIDNEGLIKTAYGNAFAIFGLSEYYKISGDTSALRLAIDTFKWLEKNSYDPVNGGYFQFLSAEGSPFNEGYRNTPPKDYNSSIHLLEAFTELFKIRKNETLKMRLHSLLEIIRDTIVTDKGYMNLFFRNDWTHVSYRDSVPEIRRENYYYDHISFGHDVETAYLMIETSKALGLKEDSITLATARRLVDHAINSGWDKEYGGLYDGGYYFKDESVPVIVKDTKEWWSQAEALNSFLMMSEYYPDDKINYFGKFLEQWDYIKNFLIDKEYGGWYWGGLDKEEKHKFTPKASIWKANYHTSRALINCLKILEAGNQ